MVQNIWYEQILFREELCSYTVLDLSNVIDNQYQYTAYVYIGTINSNNDAMQLKKNYIVIWETIRKCMCINCIIFHCTFCCWIEII